MNNRMFNKSRVFKKPQNTVKIEITLKIVDQKVNKHLTTTISGIDFNQIVIEKKSTFYNRFLFVGRKSDASFCVTS